MRTVILCEGFDDRSFLSAWLKRLGVRSLRDDIARQVELWGSDPKPNFLFESKDGPILVQACQSRTGVRKEALAQLRDQEVKELDHLIVNVDDDLEADDRAEAGLDLVRGIVEQKGSGPFQVDRVTVHPLIWRCDDPADSPGVPNKQTLERLLAAAIAEAYPDRAASVERWLIDPPVGSRSAKSFAKSYDAKWFSPKFDDPFVAVWSDEKIAAGLEDRLRASGAYAGGISTVWWSYPMPLQIFRWLGAA
jgi:hypothetical protein